MGTVYRARDPGLDREVALKTIAPQQLAERDALERFRREARAAARLQHPNIVTIYELGEVGGIHYIAMELLHGVSLAEAMRRKLLAPSARLRVAIDVCQGLDYAHKNGVLHRDVKPANVVLLRTARPRSWISASRGSTTRRSPARGSCSGRRATCLRRCCAGPASTIAATCGRSASSCTSCLRAPAVRRRAVRRAGAPHRQ